MRRVGAEQYGEFRKGYQLADGKHDQEDTRLLFYGIRYVTALTSTASMCAACTCLSASRDSQGGRVFLGCHQLPHGPSTVATDCLQQRRTLTQLTRQRAGRLSDT